MLLANPFAAPGRRARVRRAPAPRIGTRRRPDALWAPKRHFRAQFALFCPWVLRLMSAPSHHARQPEVGQRYGALSKGFGLMVHPVRDGLVPAPTRLQ